MVENRSTIMDDAFIRLYIGELLRSLRTQYLIDLIKPYTRLELSFLAQQLNVDKDEVEELLIGLILDGKVDGRIDQVTMRLELDKQSVLISDSFQLSADQPMAQTKPRKATICGA
jgi:COP9 signalosome complex subunit 2